MHKRLVAGLSRLVTCLQSNFIGTNFAGFCSNFGVRGLFSSPFVSYWVHIDWLAPGYLVGAGNPTISRKTETQVGAASQLRQPHTKSVKIRHKEVEVIDCCIYTKDQTLKGQKTFSIIKYKDLQNKILNKNCQILQKWLLLIPVYNLKNQYNF